MKKEGKNIAKAHAGVEKRPYVLQDAVPLLQKVKFAKFDETVEITLRLGYLLGEPRTDALDQPRSEVSLDALDRAGRRRSQERGSKLGTVISACFPSTACGDGVMMTRRSSAKR